MYRVYINDKTNEMVMTLERKGVTIESYFHFIDDIHLEEIVRRYDNNHYWFIKDSLLDDKSELPDYLNNPDFQEFTHYFYGNYQGL